MPDMLVKLYDLGDTRRYDARVAADGIVVRRMDAWDREAVRRFISEHFTEGWASEADFAFSHGHPITGFAATKDGEVAGFAVYESSRRGYFGPTGVRKDLRGGGAGAALLFRCLESMREMGYGYAIIGWVGPAAFYEKVCGATIIPGSAVGVYGHLQRETRERLSRQRQA
jgi:predicted GNAT family acetyltransferase